jgi:hypothetical protein
MSGIILTADADFASLPQFVGTHLTARRSGSPSVNAALLPAPRQSLLLEV